MFKLLVSFSALVALALAAPEAKPHYFAGAPVAYSGLPAPVPAVVPGPLSAALPLSFRAGLPVGLPAALPAALPAHLPAAYPAAYPAAVPAPLPAAVRGVPAVLPEYGASFYPRSVYSGYYPSVHHL